MSHFLPQNLDPDSQLFSQFHIFPLLLQCTSRTLTEFCDLELHRPDSVFAHITLG